MFDDFGIINSNTFMQPINYAICSKYLGKICAKCFKVPIFWEGHKILRNLHQLFVLCTASQIIGGDFAKFCGLHRI